MAEAFWLTCTYEGHTEPGMWRFRDDDGQPLDMHQPPFPPSLDAQMVGRKCSLRIEIIRKRKDAN